MQKDKIIINSIKNCPNSYGISHKEGKEIAVKGKIGINFSYKSMVSDVVFLYEEFITDNPSHEEIKDKIIEVLQ